MYSLLNIGSSKAKYLLIDNKYQIHAKQSFALHESDMLIQCLQNTNHGQNLLVNNHSSILTEYSQLLKQWNIFDKERIYQKYNTKNFYSKFGADRLINILGAMEYFPLNTNKIFIIDSGTYTTCTAFVYDLEYTSLEYNSISLGISAQLSLSNSKNHNLPQCQEYNFIQYIMNNQPQLESQTIQAFYRGIILHNINFIELLQSQYTDYQFIITGGWAEIIKIIKKDILIYPNLWACGAYKYLLELQRA